MQKITLKYEYESEYSSPHTCTLEFNLDSMSFHEFLEELKRFALIVGYQPETVQNAFPEY